MKNIFYILMMRNYLHTINKSCFQVITDSNMRVLTFMTHGLWQYQYHLQFKKNLCAYFAYKWV